jgi:hypothetical protein
MSARPTATPFKTATTRKAVTARRIDLATPRTRSFGRTVAGVVLVIDRSPRAIPLGRSADRESDPNSPAPAGDDARRRAIRFIAGSTDDQSTHDDAIACAQQDLLIAVLAAVTRPHRLDPQLSVLVGDDVAERSIVGKVRFPCVDKHAFPVDVEGEIATRRALFAIGNRLTTGLSVRAYSTCPICEARPLRVRSLELVACMGDGSFDRKPSIRVGQLLASAREHSAARTLGAEERDYENGDRDQDEQPTNN